MAQVIMSTDIDPVNVQVFGNWFSFKPGQVKVMDSRIVDFLNMEKRYMGFVALPDVCMEDPEHPDSVAAKAEAIRSGRNNIIADLTKLVTNLEVSLQKDYDMAGIKTTSMSQEGKAHLPYYKKLAKFKELGNAETAATLDEISQLKAQLDGDAKSPDLAKTDNRS